MASTLVAEANRACLDACTECAQACEACAQACLTDTAMTECTRLCLDCAAICQACVTLLARGSAWASRLCQLCADLCDACAAECERYDMAECRECARTCRACAARWPPEQAAPLDAAEAARTPPAGPSDTAAGLGRGRHRHTRRAAATPQHRHTGSVPALRWLAGGRSLRPATRDPNQR